MSQLRVARTPERPPQFPVVDAHNHLGRWLSGDNRWLVQDVGELLSLMDQVGVQTIVNLDGRWGDELRANLSRYDLAHPGRFATFCHVDWSALSDEADDGSTMAGLQKQLADSAHAGARGVKIWKDLGLSKRDASGGLVTLNDSRIVAVVRTAGELRLPVLIHTADPVAFFEPLDEANERVDELVAHPEWWFGGPDHPTFDALMCALDDLVGACPGTTFIGAHVGCWAEDLAGVARMLDRHPNWNIDLGGRLAEIGRQPRAFAALVERFPDRVLFGTDAYPPTADAYARYYRFLETADEHFPYSPEPVPPQGRWAIYGCALDPALLPGLYADNARRLLNLP
jgi:predicted TIM-barrel fold metal-dependent hydrolase